MKGIVMATEYELRHAVMQAEIKPTVKVVMLTILMKIDWHTWTSTITLKSIADYCKGSYRSVIRALDELEELDWIEKSTIRVKAKNTPTKITVHHLHVFHSANLSHDKMSQCQNVTRGSAKMSHTMCQNVSMDGDKLSHNTLINNINNINNNTDEDYEHYKIYYAKMGFNICEPIDADKLRPQVLEYRLSQEPTWKRLNKFTSYSQAKDELLKRAQWLNIPLGREHIRFIKSEIENEGATWRD